MKKLRKTIRLLECYALPQSYFARKIKRLKNKSISMLQILLNKLHITPNILTLLNLLCGLASLWLLFVNYWYFVGAMAASFIFAIVKSSNSFYDHCVDYIVMIGMAISFSIYLHQPFWCIIPGLYCVIQWLNYRLGSPIKISSCRSLVFFPCVSTLLILGFIAQFIYSVVLTMVLCKKVFYPLQNPPLHGHTRCTRHATVVHNGALA